MVCRNIFTVYLYRIGINKAGEAFDKLHAVTGKATLVTGMNALNISLAVFYQSGPVKAMFSQVKAVVRAVLNGFSNVRAIPHHFFGYAANVNAGAAYCFCLNYRCPGTPHCSPVC